MPNNQPTRNFFGISLLVKYLVGGLSVSLGWFTQPALWIMGVFLEYLFNWLAKKGIYIIDLGSTYVRTNMDEANWVKVVGDGWEKVNSGVTDEEGKAIDEKVKSAFDKFVVFSKVRNN